MRRKIIGFVLGAAFLAAGALIAQQKTTDSAAIPSNAGSRTFRQVCAGADCDGVISPDGRYLSRIDDDREGISVRDVATGQIRQIAQGDRPNNFAWAPDGKRVAYTLAQGSGAINIVNVDGGGERTVYPECGGLCYAVGWSPDGKRLLIRARSDMLWVGVADGSVQSLPAVRGGIGWGTSVSPDGQYVAFGVGKGSIGRGASVYVRATDGLGETIVSASQETQTAIGWTPDGHLFFVQRNRLGPVSLWAVQINNGKPGVPVLVHRFPEGSSTDFSGVTHSGAVYYRTVTDVRDIFVASTDPATGKIISAAKLLPPSRTVLGIWSPDGKRILRVSQPAGSDDFKGFAIYSPDSGEDQRVAFDAELSVMAFCWAPDSASILFNRRAAGRGQSEPVRFNLNTGAVTTLFPGAEPGTFRAKTCSENLVADSDDTTIKVRRLGTQTGEEKTIYQFAESQRGQNYVPFLSHDGRSVAFEELLQDGSTALFVIPSAGGTPKELAKARPPEVFNNVRGMAWSPDDRFVYFFRRSDSKAPFELFRVPAGGGVEESTGLKGAGFGSVDIAPDGKHVVFGVGGQQPEIWAMENFLPPVDAKGAKEFKTVSNAAAVPLPAVTPANAAAVGPAGRWVVADAPNAPWTLILKVAESVLTGTVQQSSGDSGPTQIAGGKVEGNTVSFVVLSPDGERAITFRGRINGNEASFVREVAVLGSGTLGGNDLYGASAPLQFVAVRTASGSEAPIPPVVFVPRGEGVTGTWLIMEVANAPWTLLMEQKGAKVTGTIRQTTDGVRAQPATIREGIVEGKKLKFNIDGQRGNANGMTFDGVIDGETISFSRTGGERGGEALYGAGGARQFTARRW